MKSTQLKLIRNPFISVKMVRKVKDVSETELQAWAISALLINAFGVNAVRAFLVAFFERLLKDRRNAPAMAEAALLRLEEMANDKPNKITPYTFKETVNGNSNLGTSVQG